MALQTAQAAPLHDISGVPIDVAQRKQAGGDNAKAYRAPNRTGLPDRLKAGVEARSGLSLDRVRVHTNSDQPAQLNAHAFTRGTDIHVAPRQERHLPHEAWHVVQQAQGRVRPTISVAGESVNDDAALEREADTLGAASAAHGAKVFSDGAPNLPTPGPTAMAGAAVQRVIEIKHDPEQGTYARPYSRKTLELIRKVKEKVGDEHGKGWRRWILGLAATKATVSFDDIDGLVEKLQTRFPKRDTGARARPVRATSSPGTAARGIRTANTAANAEPAAATGPPLHRASASSIRSNTESFLSGQATAADFDTWSDRLIRAAEQHRDLTLGKVKSVKSRENYKKVIDRQIETARTTRQKLKDAVQSGGTPDFNSRAVQAFVSTFKSLHGNVDARRVPGNVHGNGPNLDTRRRATSTPGNSAAPGTSTPRRAGASVRSADKLGFEKLDRWLQRSVEPQDIEETKTDEADRED